MVWRINHCCQFVFLRIIEWNKFKSRYRLLLPQLTNEVQLMVYDNHSEIPVVELFSQEELTQFTIVRNLTHVGGDANIARCFENCDTKWLWVLSDDDWVKPDAVKIVWDMLVDNSDALWINFDSSENVTLTSFDAFLENNCTQRNLSDMLWISKSVHNMYLERDYVQYQYKYLSSMYVQVMILIKYLEHNSTKSVKMIRMKTGLFDFKSPEVSWSKYDYIRLTNILFEAFDGEVLRKMKKTILRALSRFCILSLLTLTVPKSKQIYLLRLITIKWGCYNLCRYCFKEYLIFIIHIILPPKVEHGVRRIIRKYK